MLPEALADAHEFAESEDCNFVHRRVDWFLFLLFVAVGLLNDTFDHLVDERYEVGNEVVLHDLCLRDAVDELVNTFLLCLHTSQNLVEFILRSVLVLR